MRRLSWSWVWLLVLNGLAACATIQPSEAESPGCEVAAEAVPFQIACNEERSLLVLCDGQQCSLYRCRVVMEHLSTGRVVPTKGGALLRPGTQGGTQRYWGSAQELPWNEQSVFVIPWGSRPLLPSQQKELADTAEERSKPHEQHHIFPRAFRVWFTEKGINIDEYVMPLLVEKHRSIHRGVNGGPWNAAWDKFIRENRNASPEEIYRYAGQLIYEFELFGPVKPYWRHPIRPMPPGY